jgi:hypothetical protein
MSRRQGSSKRTSFGLLAAKNHTRGSRFRDQSVLLVGDSALDVADRVVPPHDGSFRFELCLPDRAKEIDFQFHSSKGSSGARVLANAMPIAASAISQRIPPCSVPMGFACCGPAAKTTVARPVSDVFCLKSNQPRDGNVVRLCAFPEVPLRGIS